MAIITDLKLLLLDNSISASEPGLELTINTTNKTIGINPGVGDLPLSTDGVTFQALYSALKILWKNSDTFIKFPFPFESITPEQYEVINGWTFLNDTTRKAIRTAGWAERNISGNIVSIYSGIISLGSLGSEDQPYFFQHQTDGVQNFTFKGPVNEAVLVYSDPNGDGLLTDGFDYRSSFKIYCREMQKTFSEVTLTDIGVSVMTYIVYRFPLTNIPDLKIEDTDTYIENNPNIYSNIVITFYETNQSRTIGDTSYNFNILIEGDGQTSDKIYEKVQYLLRQTSDIDSGSGTIIGKLSPSLLKFVGDTLVTSRGVYIDNFNANDTNRIEFYDINNTKCTFPFVAAGTIFFNSNLQNDPDAVYRMFFESVPDGNFGTASAILVKDSSNLDISGTVSGNSSVSFSFNYDSNEQGGRTHGTDASIIVVGIGLTTGTYVSSSSVITRSVGQSISLVSSRERNYASS